MVFFVALKQIAEVESEELYKMFKIEFDKLLIGSLSLPIYIPGTNYYRGFKGRGNIVKILTELIEKRRASRANNHDDLLELLLREMDAKNALNDVEIIDQIITILYSGCETVSTTLMMAVKYLHDHQEALQELRVKD
ncbi:cytochrome P450 [Striga asiatica]|uniref:Cytochrome P450 n=1 Tax=Striga asiatica TaxID=4170 RepID=A0A5A7QGY9_STRAF|nr:cytochrome P450 [Striga asiatica]